ncbi:MAG: aminopeptidase [Defluviitaleaceae bacterium]|nr:aminopeptidase [Defluviitaleaceae bacterium]
MTEAKLKKYAELLVRAGGNVQKGQLVVINVDVNDARFGRMVRDCAYDAGASEVFIIWEDDSSVRERYLRADSSVFDTFPEWTVERFRHFDESGAVYLRITSSDPGLLAGTDPDRRMRAAKAASIATKPHAKLMMDGTLRWSVCAVPSPAWAKTVFPDLTEEQGMERLWESILKGARADGEDPIADWKAHKQSFVKKVEYLNKKQFTSLRLTTGLGTDLTIGLVKNHRWVGGGGKTKDGVETFPNLPTEEVFTMPDRNKANGKVVASMPLAYNGNLIEDIIIEFKDGRVTNYSASKNEESLKNMIEMDEGAHRLGEVALVANSSPISQMGILFYNTLFDENASAHLALGRAYPKNIEGGGEMTTEALTAAGGNDSLIHVDFMFGTADLRVIGIDENGNETVFFDKGEFVF